MVIITCEIFQSLSLPGNNNNLSLFPSQYPIVQFYIFIGHYL